MFNEWGEGMCSTIESNISLKKRQNAPFSFTAFHISLQVKISYQNVSYCTRKSPCFNVFDFFPTAPNRFKYRKNECFRYIVFNYFSELLSRFKYHRNA